MISTNQQKICKISGTICIFILFRRKCEQEPNSERTMVKINRSTTSIINLSNSIIGVSILAMPLCFKQCGIILALFIISFSAVLNNFSCYLLLKSAIINRRRNYELLAYDVFGSSGKTLVEVCILFFLLGTCVAFFVIVGDIAPSLIAHIFNIGQGPQLRAMIMTVLAMFVILPLGLMRNVDSLTSFSMISLIVYLFLALRMLFLAFDKFISQPSVNIMNQINYWNSTFTITYLPIFSMALSCQSQLFEIFNSDLFQTKSGSLKSIMRSIRKAILISSIVYIVIGSFGYIAFYDVNFTGNILQNLPSGLTTKLTLLFFLITILTSFPLCLFPSRTSLHSLLFRKGAHNDFLSTSHSIHMSDHHFKLLTIILIITTMAISIIFPRVELILALVGSTIGSIICFIFPALIFIKICDKNTAEYLFSYILLFFGTAILIFCTMSALHNISMARDNEIEEKILEFKKSTLTSVKGNNLDGNKNSPDTILKKKLPQNEMRLRINNINKLKQSIQNDMNRLKKQEDILKRLEKQQIEQSKLLKEQQEKQQKMLNELKTHEQIYHSVNKSNISPKMVNKIIENNLTIYRMVETNLKTEPEHSKTKNKSILTFTGPTKQRIFSPANISFINNNSISINNDHDKNKLQLKNSNISRYQMQIPSQLAAVSANQLRNVSNLNVSSRYWIKNQTNSNNGPIAIRHTNDNLNKSSKDKNVPPR